MLRHTAASRWLAAGGSEGGLMAIAGWRRPDMLDRYAAATRASRAIEEARGRRPLVDVPARPDGNVLARRRDGEVAVAVAVEQADLELVVALETLVEASQVELLSLIACRDQQRYPAVALEPGAHQPLGRGGIAAA